MQRKAEQTGPNKMARDIEERLSALEAEKQTLKTKAEKRRVNQRMHSLKILLRWCKTRAGYVG